MFNLEPERQSAAALEKLISRGEKRALYIMGARLMQHCLKWDHDLVDKKLDILGLFCASGFAMLTRPAHRKMGLHFIQAGWWESLTLSPLPGKESFGRRHRVAFLRAFDAALGIRHEELGQDYSCITREAPPEIYDISHRFLAWRLGLTHMSAMFDAAKPQPH